MGEPPLAKIFLAQIPDQSLTLFDKGFWSAHLLLNPYHQGDERHWLLPERKGIVREIVKNYAEDDDLVRMKVDLVYQELWGLLLSYNAIKRGALWRR